MGVYIKGMEMPKSGAYEVSIDNTNGRDKTVISMFVRGEGGFICCGVYEIVPVPPHGRLIDADEAIGHLFIGEQCLYSWDEIEEAVDATDTIIPADPAEEGEA